MATKYPMFIINSTIPLALRMNPNPNNITISSAKVFSKTRTIGGWVFEHWGQQPEVMRVNGITKAMNDKNQLIIESAFFALKSLYYTDKREVSSLLPKLAKEGSLVKKIITVGLSTEDLSKLAQTYIYYKFDYYKGFFTSFNWEQSAERPFIYTYNFEFLITDSAQNLLRDQMFFASGTAGAAVATTLGLAGTIQSISKL